MKVLVLLGCGHWSLNQATSALVNRWFMCIFQHFKRLNGGYRLITGSVLITRSSNHELSFAIEVNDRRNRAGITLLLWSISLVFLSCQVVATRGWRRQRALGLFLLLKAVVIRFDGFEVWVWVVDWTITDTLIFLSLKKTPGALHFNRHFNDVIFAFEFI